MSRFSRRTVKINTIINNYGKLRNQVSDDGLDISMPKKKSRVKCDGKGTYYCCINATSQYARVNE